MAKVWIGLGSNLDTPSQQVLDAFVELSKLPKTKLVQKSSLWRSKPLGPQNQPDFINAAAEILTQLKPLELLDELQAIEKMHQRKRERHWGPRTLDLDILLYDKQQLASERLTLPHPEMTKRAFVLLPLAELDENLNIANQGSVKLLIQQLGKEACNEVLPFEAKVTASF